MCLVNFELVFFPTNDFSFKQPSIMTLNCNYKVNNFLCSFTILFEAHPCICAQTLFFVSKLIWIKLKSASFVKMAYVPSLKALKRLEMKVPCSKVWAAISFVSLSLFFSIHINLLFRSNSSLFFPKKKNLLHKNFQYLSLYNVGCHDKSLVKVHDSLAHCWCLIVTL